MGVPDQAASDFVAYQKNPTKDNAVRAVRHYATIAGMNLEQRRTLFHHKTDSVDFAKVFQSLEAVKFDLVNEVNARVQGLSWSMRAGSTAQRYNEWVDWVVNKNRNLDDMPGLDPNKQFSSDDDVTNFPSAAALRKNFAAGEAVNGESAKLKFIDYVQKTYKVRIDPQQDLITEFLSPTQTHQIALQQGQIAIKIPDDTLQAWVMSDPEKYNGMFAEEQLHEWAMKNGMVIADPNNPLSSAQGFKAFYEAQSQNDRFYIPRGYEHSTLTGWMANNHRQVFQVHKGHLHYLGKYTERMLRGWIKTGVDPPKGPQGISAQSILEACRLLYNPPPDTKDLLSELKRLVPVGNINEIKQYLVDYNRQLLIDANRQNAKRLRIKLKLLGPPDVTNKSAKQAKAECQQFADRIKDNEDFQKILQDLALTYANIDDELKAQLIAELEKQIKLGNPDDASKAVDPEKAYQAFLSRHLKGIVQDVDISVSRLKTNAEIYRNLKAQLGSRINVHLNEMGKLNLDDYLVKVAQGQAVWDDYQWDGSRLRKVQVQLDPEKISGDMRTLQSMAKYFSWSDKDLAGRVKEYFLGQPHEGLQLLRALHEVAHPDKVKPMTVRIQKADGSYETKTIQPTRLQGGMSLGVLTFKGALKGWDIFGDVESGYQLLGNLKTLATKVGMSSEEWGKMMAMNMAAMIDLREYITGGKIFDRAPYAGTMGALAGSAGNAFQDRKLYQNLTMALAKDLSVLYYPGLTYAYAVYGLGQYGFDKYALWAGTENVVAVLVENGKWEYPKKQDGTEDKSKPPELKSFELISKDGLIRPVDCGSKPLESIKILAKKLDDKGFAGGTKLKKSGGLVITRDELVDLVHRKGIADKDTLLTASMDAIENHFGIGLSWPVHTTFWRNITEEWLKRYYGVTPNTREDALTVNDKDKLKVDLQAGWATWASNQFFEKVAKGSIKTFAWLVQDYWVRRQKLIELRLLPEIYKMAQKKTVLDDLAQTDPDDFIKEAEKLKERMKELDKRVWPNIARSADPFPGPGYDEEQDTPITDHWWNTIQDKLELLQKIQAWLKDHPDRDAPDTFTAMAELQYSGQVKLTWTPKEVLQEAGGIMGEIGELVHEAEDNYEKCLKIMEGREKRIDTIIDLGIKPYHVKLTPQDRLGSWGRYVKMDVIFADADLKNTQEWDGNWRLPPQEVDEDVAALLQEMGFKAKHFQGWSWAEKIWEQATGRDPAAVHAARSHPYWRKLAALKLQIKKLSNVTSNIDEVSKEEMEQATTGMRLWEIAKDPDSGQEELKEKKLKQISVASLQGRKVAAKERLTALNESYDMLLAYIRKLFDLNISLNPERMEKSRQVFHFTQVLQAEIELERFPRSPSLDAIQEMVKGYRFEIIGHHPDTIKGLVLTDKLTKKPAWAHRMLRRGLFTLKVSALGKNRIPLAYEKVPIATTKGVLTGNLVVRGDWGSDFLSFMHLGKRGVQAQPHTGGHTVRLMGDPIVQAPSQGGLSSMGGLVFVGKVQKPGSFNIALDSLSPKWFKPVENGGAFQDPGDKPPDFLDGEFLAKARVWEKHQLMAVSNEVTVRHNGDEFSLNEDLEVVLPTKVTISATVRDASGKKIQVDELVARSGQQRAQAPDMILLLHDKDKVWMEAARKDVPVQRRSQYQVYAYGKHHKEMAFDFKMPFYDTGNFRASGRLVTPKDSAATITGGLLEVNVADDQPLDGGDAFDFVNNKPLLIKAPLILSGLFHDKDKAMYRFPGGSLTKSFQITSHLQFNPVVEPYTIDMSDKIKIHARDLAGDPLPMQGTEVTVGDKKAVFNYSHWLGSWIFTKFEEQVPVRVQFSLPDGTKAKGEAQLHISDLGPIHKPRPPSPIKIRAPLFLDPNLRIQGQTKVRVPQGKGLPDEVSLDCQSAGITEKVQADSTFELRNQIPVKAGAQLVIQGKAKKDGIKYKGQSNPVIVPSSNAPASARVIVLAPDTKQNPVTIEKIWVRGATGKGQPIHGQGLKWQARVLVGDVPDPLACTASRLSDGFKTEKEVKANNQALQLKGFMGPVPRARRSIADQLRLNISSGQDISVSKMADFEWKEEDYFSHFRFLGPDSSGRMRMGTRFSSGDSVQIFSYWTAAENLGTSRSIEYTVDGKSLSRQEIANVAPGQTIRHQVMLDTKGLAGRIRVSARLINPDPHMEASGSGGFNLDQGEDHLERVWVSPTEVEKGNDVTVTASIQAADNKDGVRTLTGRCRLQTAEQSVSLKGGESVDVNLTFPTSQLRVGRKQSVYMKLIDERGKFQDSETLWFKVKKKTQTGTGAQGQGGLTNVTCTVDMITIKMWDHQSQDGDIISLKMGPNWVRKGLNLNACGGPSEPGGGPCVFTNLQLPPGSRIPISIYAHNQGKVGPNTAALRVLGGCTPENQRWSLKKGQGATIYIIRQQ